jgi:hypothetical protein
VWFKDINETAISIVRTKDKGYLVAGNCYTSLSSNDLWIVKFDKSGKYVFNCRMGGKGNDQLTFMKPLSDPPAQDKFILTGFTNSVGKTPFSMFTLRFNLEPDMISVDWGNAYELNGTGYAYSVDQMADGSFVLAGSCHMPQTNSLDAIILKLNSNNGSPIWPTGYGGTSYDDKFLYVQKTSKGCVVGGYNRSFPTRPYHNPFTGIKTEYHNVWVMNLNNKGKIDGDDKCMRRRVRDPILYGLPFDPACKGQPDVKDPNLEVTEIESIAFNPELGSKLLC